MKITVLGSGGGEGFPAPFCSCEHCETARKMGGKSLRSLSQALVNDDLLIDLPYDTNAHCLKFGINLGKIQNFLITHSHSDHYMPHLLSLRGGLNAHGLKHAQACIYGPDDLESICDRENVASGIRSGLKFTVLSEGTTVQIGAYNVTPLKALHAPKLGSLNYVIGQKDKRLLYLVDSGYPTDETLSFLKERNEKFDGVIMDGTMGYAPLSAYRYHMGYEENILLKSKLESLGLTHDRTRFAVTHITHNKSEYHEKTEEIFRGTGIEVAYDGLEWNL